MNRRMIVAGAACLGLLPAMTGAQAAGAQVSGAGSRVSGTHPNFSVSGAGAGPRVSGAPYPLPATGPMNTYPAAQFPPTGTPIPSAPANGASRRIAEGDMLPASSLAPESRITDFTRYGLPAPAAGTAWVRVGSDVVLADTSMRMVLRVEYGAID